jgi:hypothetical protein
VELFNYRPQVIEAARIIDDVISPGQAACPLDLGGNDGFRLRFAGVVAPSDPADL